MSTSRLTTTSYVVLGMIAMRGRSTSYDLKRAVGHSVGYFWPFPHAQLYSEPKRLAALGLLDLEIEDEGRRRQLYDINQRGREELKVWLARRGEDPLQVRDIAELKLFFGEFADPDDLTSLAAEQIAQHRSRILEYEQIQHRFADRPDVASRLVPLGLGLRIERAALSFWEELLDGHRCARP
ncbi:MAG: hypothetical protein QOH56_823 [Pseudonocardiales bacterium]|jgi:PadR family transcriptional regulator AphA|nr:hypothetical protein [Pseudonocardiales bacterium]